MDERFRRTATSKTELDSNGKWFGCMFFFLCSADESFFFFWCAHVFLCDRQAEGTGAARKRQLHPSQGWFKIDPDGGKRLQTNTLRLNVSLTARWAPPLICVRVCGSGSTRSAKLSRDEDAWGRKVVIKPEPAVTGADLQPGYLLVELTGFFLGPDYRYHKTSMGGWFYMWFAEIKMDKLLKHLGIKRFLFVMIFLKHNIVLFGLIF